MSDRVTMPFEFAVEQTRDGIELIAEREVINFVREVIPDGQMAGMMGHRPVPGEERITFEIPRQQAQLLLEDLARALGRVIS